MVKVTGLQRPGRGTIGESASRRDYPMSTDGKPPFVPVWALNRGSRLLSYCLLRISFRGPAGMSAEQVERRLAAILVADVAAYSRLMGADEEATLRDLKAHRSVLLEPKQTRIAGSLTIANTRSLYVLTVENLPETSQLNGWDGNDSQHPPCRPGCLLCLRRAAARPFVARQVHRRRWRGCACRFVNDFTPLVERISIDEAFADVAGCSHLFGPPAEIARAIRRRVRAELGLPISVGVARTKHLAKIASQVAKPDGLVVVDPDTELEFLHHLPVELMWAGHQGASGRDRRAYYWAAGKDTGMVARAVARSRGGRETRSAGVESRSTGDRDSPTGRIGRSAVGDR
jgi:impB/mucB/samB family